MPKSLWQHFCLFLRFEIAVLEQVPVAHPNFEEIIEALIKDKEVENHPTCVFLNKYNYSKEAMIQSKKVVSNSEQVSQECDISKAKE
jgi:hypothetical protein